MNNRFQAYWIFLPLGLAFLIFNRGGDEVSLSCAFYAFFVGVVWTLIPRFSIDSSLSWRHLLPPVLLILLMMFGSHLRMMNNAEAMVFTAMALIHLRASILSFSRLPRRGRVFSFLQFLSFVWVMVYIFQKNIFSSTLVSRTHFLSTMMLMGMGSMIFLWSLKKKHEPAISEASDT